MEKRIITISREFGSAGRTIGHAVADKLGIPFYDKEGKGSVHIGVGCTGGRHRSVYCAEMIAGRLRENGIQCITTHRDVDKEPHRYTKKADEP